MSAPGCCPIRRYARVIHQSPRHGAKELGGNNEGAKSDHCVFVLAGITHNTTYNANKLGFELGSDLVNESTTSVRNLVNDGPPGTTWEWSHWTIAAGRVERVDSPQHRTSPGQGCAVVLAVGALWGHPRVPQVGKPPSPRGKWERLESWWSRASGLLRAGNKSEPVRGLHDVSRRRWAHLQCISAKNRTEWLIAAACMFVGYRGMQKLYLCQLCSSFLHSDDFRTPSPSLSLAPSGSVTAFRLSASQIE